VVACKMARGGKEARASRKVAPVGDYVPLDIRCPDTPIGILLDAPQVARGVVDWNPEVGGSLPGDRSAPLHGSVTVADIPDRAATG
jgi:hypothetical protein